jgi:hypothetical protein
MMSEFIRGCPFCDSHEVEIARTNQDACWVVCAHCFAQAESSPKRIDAIANWNRRNFDDHPSVIVQDMDRDG